MTPRAIDVRRTPIGVAVAATVESGDRTLHLYITSALVPWEMQVEDLLHELRELERQHGDDKSVRGIGVGHGGGGQCR